MKNHFSHQFKNVPAFLLRDARHLASDIKLEPRIIKNKNINTVNLTIYGLFFLGIGTLITALSSNIIIVIFAYLIIGFGASTAPIGIRSLLQINISKNMIGRVFTSVRFIVTSLRTLSISIFSVLAGYINLRFIFVIAASIIFLSSFIALSVKNTLSTSTIID